MYKLNCFSRIQSMALAVISLSPVMPATVRAARVTDGLIALYYFNESSGEIIHDRSPFGAPLNLRIPTGHLGSNVHWLGTGGCTAIGGICVTGDTVIESIEGASKLADALATTNDITIEAWVSPANDTQGDDSIGVPIVDMALGNNESFTLNQRGGAFGGPVVGIGAGIGRIYTNDNVVQAGVLQHVVFTSSDESDASNLYVDAQPLPPTHRQWRIELDPEHPLALAGRPQAFVPWHGEVYLVAIYNRALSLNEIGRNYDAGPNIPEPSAIVIGLLGILVFVSFTRGNLRP